MAQYMNSITEPLTNVNVLVVLTYLATSASSDLRILMWLPSNSLYVRLTISILMPGNLNASILAFCLTAQDLLNRHLVRQAPPYPTCFCFALKNNICLSFGLGIFMMAIRSPPFGIQTYSLSHYYVYPLKRL